MPRVALALFLLASLVPATAYAARIATPKEKRAIAAAVREYVRTSGCCAASRVGLTLYRVSTIDPDFARVTVIQKSPSGEAGPQATAVVVHTYTGRWTTIALGTSRLVCGLHPRLRLDLGLPACR